jgi:hypothetical protein
LDLPPVQKTVIPEDVAGAVGAVEFYILVILSPPQAVEIALLSREDCYKDLRDGTRRSFVDVILTRLARRFPQTK